MNQLKFLYNLCCVALLSLLINGFQSVNAQKKSDNDLVLSANQSFYTAFQNGDIKQMDQVWSHSPFVSAIHPIGNDVIIGWKGVRDSFDGVFKAYTNINILPVKPTVHIEGNVAWVLQNEEFSAKQGDKTVKLTSAANNIFVKNAGKWLMVHHQATVAMTPKSDD
jgi:ketosteroid isomerase-like protein